MTLVATKTERALGRRQLTAVSAVVLWVACVSVSGCMSTGGDFPPPPQGAFYYPTAISMLPPLASSPERRFALVSSSNFDLQYASGWMSVVDVDVLLTSPEPAAAVVQQLAIPSFGGPIAIDASLPLVDGDTRLAVVGHRGSSLLSIIEVSVSDGLPHLSCGDANATTDLSTVERYTDCDRRHLYALNDASHLEQFDTEPEAYSVTDPYAMTFFTETSSGEQKLAVGFLSQTSEANTILLTLRPDVASGAGSPLLVPERMVTLGRAGTGAIVARPAVDCIGEVSLCPTYLAASIRRLSTYSVTSSVFSVSFEPDGTSRALVHGLTESTGGGQGDGLAFAPDGSRAYVVNNGPDGIVQLDATLTSHPLVSVGVLSNVVSPAYRFIDGQPLTGRPSALVYLTRSEGDVVAAAGFASDEVTLTAVTNSVLVPLAQIRDVGSGPLTIASVSDAADQLLLIGTFYDHGVTIIRVPSDNAAAAAVVACARSTELGDASAQ